MSSSLNVPEAPPLINATIAAVVIQEVVARFIETQAQAVHVAADLILDAFARGGIIQVFGSGHSEGFVMEMVNRAGGLVAASGLSMRDLPEPTPDHTAENGLPIIERDPAYAAKVLDAWPTDPNDIFMIASHSGVNGVIVEMARLVKARGHRLIAITSMAHSSAMESRHPSGQHLYELADVTIDNCGPYGDGMITLPSGVMVCAVSSITGAIAAQMIVADVVAGSIAIGRDPEIYLSSNIEGSDEYNDGLDAKYLGRHRPSKR